MHHHLYHISLSQNLSLEFEIQKNRRETWLLDTRVAKELKFGITSNRVDCEITSSRIEASKFENPWQETWLVVSVTSKDGRATPELGDTLFIGFLASISSSNTFPKPSIAMKVFLPEVDSEALSQAPYSC